MKLKIKILDPRAVVPEYKTAGASGVDLHAILEEPLLILPGERKTIRTGLAIEIPEGYEAQCRPRSGLSFNHGVVTSFGTIDSDYRGENKVCLYNHSFSNFKVMPGDRVAQLVFTKVERADIEVVNELSDTVRGIGGFGSTGVK
jgi:dUTP pyrophosphatase